MAGFEETLFGVIENVVYRNDDNDYCVIEIVDADNNLITCVGNMPLPFEGENVKLLTLSPKRSREFIRICAATNAMSLVLKVRKKDKT